MPFPILKASGLYNSLYYRTSRDDVITIMKATTNVYCTVLSLAIVTSLRKKAIRGIDAEGTKHDLYMKIVRIRLLAHVQFVQLPSAFAASEVYCM